MPRYVVAIVGRVNVGKSTLFNRLVGGRRAITQEEPGVTRDRLYGETVWRGRTLAFIDTGGVQIPGGERLSEGMRRQTVRAIEEADLVIFLVDQLEGLSSEDREVAELLHASGKPVILAANKAESRRESPHLYDCYELGFGEPIPVSALHGTGTGDLLDLVVELLPVDRGPLESSPEAEIQVAIVGRPNVGKSSLLNAILGTERVLVDDLPGTTRDAIDTVFAADGKRFRLVDTAGMRKKARVKEAVEFYSTVRAIQAIERSEVAVLVVEGSGIVQQDKMVARAIQEAGRAAVIAVNKSDLFPRNRKGGVHAEVVRQLTRAIRREFQFLGDVPIRFISALERLGLSELLADLVSVHGEFHKRIETALVNKAIREFLLDRPPPPHNRGVLKILYATQVRAAPPTFLLFVNNPDYLSLSYRRYLVNRLREAFGFEGAPVHLTVKKRRKVELPA